MIPKQEEGGRMDTGQKARFDTREEAVEFYELVKHRVQHVAGWHEMTGVGSARFNLCTAAGDEKSGLPAPGDHFRIELPAPGSPAGDGFDWVRIEAIDDQNDRERDCERYALRVRPTDNPHTDRSDTAHFFSDDATSTFMVERQGNTVTASIHGRNEKPNTNQTDNLLDKARNALIGVPAASGFSKIQWSRLVKGWMEDCGLPTAD